MKQVLVDVFNYLKPLASGWRGWNSLTSLPCLREWLCSLTTFHFTKSKKMSKYVFISAS